MPGRANESEPAGSALSGLLKQVQKAIREAPPEAWDSEARDAGDTVSASLSKRLRKLDQLDNLNGAVPCVHHPHCRAPVVNIGGKRYRHVNPDTGELLSAVMDIPVSLDDPNPAQVPHTAAPRKEGQRR